MYGEYEVITMLRYLSGGESHGPGLTAVIDGIPSNLSINIEEINRDLARRQKGYGRGDRMKIEKDKVKILSGIRNGKTLGSPVTLHIENLDWENWQKPTQPVTRPRPGHGDLAGALKYDHTDIRNVLERASARETAARVAVGSIAKTLLKEFGIEIISHVTCIGGVKLKAHYDANTLKQNLGYVEDSQVRCMDKDVEEEMIREIIRAKEEGDSVGGIFEIWVFNVPPGLGSHVNWDRKLDARLAFGLMSIQGIKGVEVGLGFEAGGKRGSEFHDEIFYSPDKGYFRKTNNAGGIEGGMTNGAPIVLRAAMKPIPTLYKPLMSVDITTKTPVKAGIERSDTCAVPSASIVGEGVVAWTLAEAFMEKFGGDSLQEVKRNYEGYMEYLRTR
jgi:chorismate synthase